MLITKKANQGIGRLKLSSHHDLRGVERGADFESVNGQWSKEACLSNEASLQTHELMGQLLVWWTCRNSRRLVSLKMAWKFCAPCLMSCPMHFCHLNYNSSPFRASPHPRPVCGFILCNFSSVQSLSPVWLFATPWTVAHQASLSITNSWSLLKLRSIMLVMPSNHPILCFSYLWSTTVWKY